MALCGRTSRAFVSTWAAVVEPAQNAVALSNTTRGWGSQTRYSQLLAALGPESSMAGEIVKDSCGRGEGGRREVAMDGWEETEGQVLKLREPEGAGGRERRMGG